MSETSTKNFPARHGSPWSKEEFQQLILAIEQGLTLSELAERHQRTSGGILGAIKRLLPSEFCQNNNVGSVSDLTRYFNETQSQERACLINALRLPAATEKKTEKKQETEGEGEQVVSSCAAVPGASGKTPDEKQITGFVPSTEFLDYVASESDVIMLVSAAVDSLSKERDRDILLMRLGTDEHPHTLAEIAAKCGVSRERVRQLQERAFKRLAGKSRYEGSPGAALKKLINAVSNSSYEIAIWVHRIVHRDFMTSSGLAAKFILCTAGIQKVKREEIVGFFSDISLLQKAKLAKLRELDRSRAAKERVESELSGWLNHTDWPTVIAPPPPAAQLSSQRIVNDSDIAGHFYSQKLARTVQYESGLELNIMTQLERSDQVSFYQEQPVAIPYSFKDKLRKYYPDLLVATVDGRCLLVEVKPTDSMALSVNRAKANAGRAWAHARGWGWLVVSDRHTLQQLEEHVIPAVKWTMIENELNASEVMTWRDMMGLRTRYELTRFDLTAYIIQSGAEVDRSYRITARNYYNSGLPIVD
ncbi:MULTISPECIES: sigma factor-like helix-turn-helix DNA-binding protein [Pectobacterium]|uniref:RNA polymerase subunit sigma n=2 Tax=Pectobacterium odoriferum TaxID=78398 RepID=A0ABD6VQ59_9GAMM|nr:sigma factor-like helix-turn-helix DNA-binding protein [Pectobacterium odoriferum]POE12905.1 RNA polymerase subunit sigma [Pectobacterium odoriferum]POE26521.1 RNA polymerase subunit sigma [Pectobacterium odoriferum]POE31204.1 RNA polymerase subunit sigma [Pectobacterium odoriferum]